MIEHRYSHAATCGFRVYRRPIDCTCGFISEADILRAQFLGTPLPTPRAHKQFKMRGDVK